jgi:hypothetical protein
LETRCLIPLPVGDTIFHLGVNLESIEEFCKIIIDRYVLSEDGDKSGMDGG